MVEKKQTVAEDEIMREIEKRAKKKFSFFGRLKSMQERRIEAKIQRRMELKKQIEKAGLSMSTSRASRMLIIICFLVNIFVTIFLINRFYADIAGNYTFLLLLLLVVWSLVFLLVAFIVWFMFYLSLDLMIFQRKQKLEEVLPDFLQLASSNIRAGMTIDQALWFAVRPRFGVLANEIQEVAKRTLAGEPLESALTNFTNRYESKVLERSMNLLIEGLNAGGEMGGLLNKIAGNIQETNLMKKEMAANVTTYVIFITFATIMAAPFLFGMAYQLIQVIQEVFSKIDIAPSAAAGFPISISEGSLSIADFQIFAVVSLLITSFFSAIIVSAIKKGNVKGGIKYIPIFMICSVTLFFIVVKMFSYIVGGFF